MRIAVGCPVYERAWSLDRWFDSIEAQALGDIGDVAYHFVYTPGRDDTLGVIERRAPDATVVVADDLQAFTNAERADTARYGVLAELRNRLVASVLATGADCFLSVDSDIVFEPGAVRQMFAADEYVVGALLDMLGEDWLMEQGQGFPSWMDFEAGMEARRPYGWRPADAPAPFSVGVVMAAVLWRREVLEALGALERAPFAFHPLGEDIAVAIQLEALGVERWLAPAARARHLHQEDSR